MKKSALEKSALEKSRGPWTVVTPEHVAVRFGPGDLGSRFGAVVLDLAILGGALFLVAAVLGGLSLLGGETTGAFFLLLFFLLRNFYFTLTEIRWQGRTIGKRVLGLRVVAADGGPLTADMVFARNLTRELEIFLPLSALLAPAELLPGMPWWVNLATFVWVLLMASLPFINPRRARLGDLLAGTMVVAEPKARLLDDLVEESREAAAVLPADLHFTPQQLAIYGIHELQILEEVLRRPPSDERDLLLLDICRRVQRKIGWEEPGARPVPPVRHGSREAQGLLSPPPWLARPPLAAISRCFTS